MRESPRFRRFEPAEIEQSLVARFAARVRSDPARLAARQGAMCWSYAELDAHANRIAQLLLARRGAGLEPVALVIDQGLPLLAAILGTLKAGKIYVPLERAHPRERLLHMLRDAGAAIALVDGAAVPLLRTLSPDLELLDLAAAAALSPDDPRLEIPPRQPAYIYYTTGSTGEPKGVVDSHRNVLHNVMRYTNALAIADDDRLTLLQSPSFSGAVSSLFAALLNGAATHPFEVRDASAAQLADYVDGCAISMWHSVPAIFRSLVRSGRHFPDVRVVRLEGDQAAPGDLALFARHFARDCTLANGLGTTETGLVRQYFFQPGMPAPAVVPIGHAVSDMTVRVVDEHGAPLPPDTVGELAIASAYLALGYWQRPEQTARAFVPDPSDPRRRIYRSGDIGRMHADGCLEHLGRKNALTKIRGVTVALAEVEAALGRVPGVRECAVDVRDSRRGERRLVAWFVAQPGTAPTASFLRRALAPTLAPQMLPTAFIAVARLPLNDNLKVDRAALPDARAERPPLDVAYCPPRNAAEARLATLCEAALGLTPVGMHDDFFDLGGDSLLATELLAAIAETTGLDVPVAVLVAGPTVAQLSAVLAQAELPRQPLVALRDAGARPTFWFLHGDYVGGGIFCRQLAKAFDADRPFVALTPCGLDGDAAPSSIEEMAERHLRVLRKVQPRGPYALGGSCNGGLVALEMARRLEAAGESVERLIVFRATARNARFIAVRRALERASACLRLPASWPRRAQRHACSFLDAWADAAPRRRVALVVSKLWRVPGALAQLLPRASSRDGVAVQATPLNSIYMDAVAEYVPPRFGGRVTVLWPEVETALESPEEALAGWRRIAGSAELEIVPGDHVTAVTVHVSAFAQRLSARLAAA